MAKKAQIQMFETIVVLFIFFILVAIGMIFYTRISKSNLDIEKNEFSQIRSVAIAQRVMFLPELQCTDDNIVKDNCIDILKLESAASIIRENQIYYYDLLEFSEVNITEIYPVPADAMDGKWTIYSRKTESYNSRFMTSVPVSLYDAREKKYSFGVLSIETRTK